MVVSLFRVVAPSVRVASLGVGVLSLSLDSLLTWQGFSASCSSGNISIEATELFSDVFWELVIPLLLVSAFKLDSIAVCVEFNSVRFVGL